MPKPKKTEQVRYIVRTSVYSDSKYKKESEKVKSTIRKGGKTTIVQHKAIGEFKTGLRIRSRYKVLDNKDAVEKFLISENKKFQKLKTAKSIDSSIQAFKGKVTFTKHKGNLIIGDSLQAVRMKSVQKGHPVKLNSARLKLMEELEGKEQTKSRSVIYLFRGKVKHKRQRGRMK